VDPAPPNPNPSPNIPEFAYLARRHLTVVLGRLQMLRRDVARERTDLEGCVTRLDDIELSVRRLEQLVDEFDGARNRG
jgi:hypothetical protein